MRSSALNTNVSREQTELGPCPSCGKKAGEIKARPVARFPYYALCKACGWMTDFVRTAGIAATRWNKAKKR
jgi:hypothetical protein